jgi:hypothetical protein
MQTLSELVAPAAQKCQTIPTPNHRLPDKIAAEEKLDGIYVIRTSVAASISK